MNNIFAMQIGSVIGLMWIVSWLAVIAFVSNPSSDTAKK